MDHTSTRSSRWRSVRLLSISLCAALAVSVGVALPADSQAADLAPAAAADEINGVVWLDRNGDGINDADEVGFANATVRLFGADGEISSLTTGPDGLYSFTGLTEGPYAITVEPDPATYPFPANFLPSTAPGPGGSGYVGTDQDFGPSGGDDRVAALGGIAPGTTADAAIRPRPELSLGQFGPGVIDGSAPFDELTSEACTDEFDLGEPGDDCGDDNGQVRTQDTVTTVWSVTADNFEPGTTTWGPVIFEQTIDLDPSDSGTPSDISFERIPVVCVAPPNGTGGDDPVSTIVDNGDGTITLFCNLGDFTEGQQESFSTVLKVSGESQNGTTFTTDQQVYVLDAADDTVDRAVPAVADPVGPIVVSAAPAYDLSKGYFKNAGVVRRTIDRNGDGDTDDANEQNVSGFLYYFNIRLAQERATGVEAIQQPITFTDRLSAVLGDGVTPYFPEWYVVACIDNPTGWGGEVLGRITQSANTPDSRKVTESGDCSYGRTDPTDTDSAYEFSIENADLSGDRFPTEAFGGADLSAGPYYVVNNRVQFFVPFETVDLSDGVIDDVGSIQVTNQFDGFDPDGLSGTSNYGPGVEPGYCDPVTGLCDLMEDGTRSNNVIGPLTLQLTLRGSFNKYIRYRTNAAGTGSSLPPGQTSSHTGNGELEPGDYVHGLVIWENNGTIPFSDPRVCDVFDNTVYQLTDAANVNGPAGNYAYMGTYSRVSSDDPAWPGNFEVQYATFDLSGDDPLSAGYSATTGRYEGDWSQQAAVRCDDDAPADGWFTDPNAVPGGIDAVNAVRAIPVDPGFTLDPAYQMRFIVPLAIRDTFVGGPNDGTEIPVGTVLANYGMAGRAPTDPANPYVWTARNYRPSPETTNQDGDRVTLTRVNIRLEKRSLQPNADFGNTGSTLAGNQVVWEVVPAVQSTLDPPTTDAANVVIVDELPVEATYNADCTAAQPNATPPDLIQANTDRNGDPAPGKTLLTWFLGDIVPNDPSAIPPRVFCTDTDPLAPNGTPVVNYSEIRADNVISTLSLRSDTHTVVLEQAGSIQLSKTVDRGIDPLDDDQVYTAEWANFASAFAVDAPTVIDVFPWNGDGLGSLSERDPASDFSGTLELTGAPTITWLDDSVPAAGDPFPELGTFTYTADDPSTIDYNPDLNASNWCAEADFGTAGCPADFTEVTAWKFVSNYDLALDGDPRQGMRVEMTLQALDNVPSDRYTNRFTLDSTSLPADQFLRSNNVSVRVAGFNLGDLLFADLDDDGVYTAGTDIGAPAGIPVEVYLDDDAVVGPSAGDTLFTTATTDAAGRWLATGLGEGDYYVRVPASVFAPGGALDGLFEQTLGFVADPNTDENETADHQAATADTLATEGIVSGVVTLSATPGATPFDPATGDEPLGDNVAGLPVTETDDFTNLTLDLGVKGLGTIGDRVWFDENGDGVQNPDEDGINGVTVTLTWYGWDGVPGGGDDRVVVQTTSGDGDYLFTDLPPGEYDVTLSNVDDDFAPTYDLDGGTATPDGSTPVSLAPAEEQLDVDFGYTVVYTLGDLVWIDADGDGVFTDGVDVVAPDGTAVELRNADGTPTGLTTTVTDGRYLFTDLPAGEYYVQIPASSFAGALSGYLSAPDGVADPNTDVDEDADHNAFDGVGGPAASGVRTGVVTLSATLDPATGAITGDEPGGYVNTTVDFALAAPADIEIQKEVCPAGVTCDPDAAVGEGGWVEAAEFPYLATVTWRITVTNTGGQNLTDVAVTDALVPACDATIGDLAIGESSSYTCETADIVESIDPNTADASGTGVVTDEPVSDDDPASATVPEPDPGIQVVKSIDGDDANTAPGVLAEPDDVFDVTFDVTVTGNVPLTDVTVTDDVFAASDIVCAYGLDADDNVIAGPLAPGETFSCAATLTVPFGQHTNTATVTGTPITGGPDVEDDDPANAFGATTGIDIIKRVQSDFDANAPTGPQVATGDTVRWTYTVNNLGNVELADVVVTDDQGVVPEFVSGDTDADGRLDPGEVWLYEAFGPAIAGQYTNIGDVTGDPVDPSGNDIPFLDDPTSDDPANYFGADPSIDVVKYVNGDDANVAPGPFITTGETAEFTYVVTNTGNVPLTDVSVDDDVIGAVDCPLDTLDVGESMTCFVTDVAVAGAYTNVATAEGTGPDTIDANGDVVQGEVVTDDDPANYFGADPAIDIVKTVQTLDADTATGPLVAEDGVVRWRFTVTNTGNVTLTDVVVTDPTLGAVTCPLTTLAAGESMDCDPIDDVAVAGQQTNVAEVEGTGPDTLAPSPVGEEPVIVPGETVDADDPANYFGASPEIDVVKSVQTFSADDAVTVYPDELLGAVPVADGDIVLYRYTVTNTGNVVLTNVVLTDDRVAIDSQIICDVNGTNVIGTMQPGDSSSCSFAITADAADHADGWTNIGSATGVGPSTVGPDGETVPGVRVGDDDPATFFVPTPSIDIEKFVQTNIDADDPTGPLIAEGDTARFVYVVTNTGNVPLTDVVVTDSVEGEICTIESIEPDAVETCSIDTVAVAGQYMNTGDVVGTPPVTYDFDGNPVTDEPVTDADDAHYWGATPAVELVKYTQTLDNDEPTGPLVAEGADVRWTYEVTNTGNVELSNVVVSDDQLDDTTIDCGEGTANVIADLAVGEVVYCEAFGVAVPGQYMNTGSVVGDTPPTYGPEGYGPDGEPGGDDDDLVEQPPVVDENPDHYFGVAIAIDVEKSVQSVFDADEVTGPLVAVGDEVVWTYVVTNTGNHELVDIELVDDQEGVITCPDTTLAVGASMTCTATGVATAGQYTNVAVVTGTGPDTVDTDGETVPAETATDEDPANYFGAEPAVEIVKSVNGEDANEAPGVIVTPGDELEFDYVVTNTGNVELFDVTVVDDQGVVVDCGEGTGNTIADLAVGESVTCTGSDVAVDGQYTNIGTVSATGPDTVGPDGEPVPGVEVSDDDPANAFGADPGIEVVKYIVVDGERVDANVEPGPSLNLNSLAEWEIVVTNTGNVVLTDVVVSDPLLDELGVSLSCAGGGNTVARLDPGQSITCTASNLITGLGLVVNEAIATGIPPFELPSVTDDDVALFTSVPSGGSGIPQLPKTGSNLTLLLLGLAVLTMGSGLFLFGVTRRRRT